MCHSFFLQHLHKRWLIVQKANLVAPTKTAATTASITIIELATIAASATVTCTKVAATERRVIRAPLTIVSCCEPLYCRIKYSRKSTSN